MVSRNLVGSLFSRYLPFTRTHDGTLSNTWRSFETEATQNYVLKDEEVSLTLLFADPNMFEAERTNGQLR